MNQFQGEMDTILEYLRTHKDSTTVTAATETQTKTISQPIPNQSGSIPGPNGHYATYPRGMPQNFNIQVINGGAFIPYQHVPVFTINGNSYAYPWGMPSHISPQIVDIDNHEVPQDQPHQNSVPVTAEAPNEIEHEYRGPPIHVQIPSITQSAVQYPYQGVQSIYLREYATNVISQLSANDALQPAHTGEPYAPYVHHRVQYPQYVNPGSQMVNNGMMYPPHMFR